ncbi:MAG: hypothetical protein QGF53_09805 [Alphaproteobacteria bacterium]|nr:hypothetical protein [Alphaproteobacteria bacterium]
MSYLPETAGERELRQPRDPEPIVTALRRIDVARAVAHVQVGGICTKSLWVVDTDTPMPSVSWPRTARGFPIIEASADLKAQINKVVLEAMHRPRWAARPR